MKQTYLMAALLMTAISAGPAFAAKKSCLDITTNPASTVANGGTTTHGGQKVKCNDGIWVKALTASLPYKGSFNHPISIVPTRSFGQGQTKLGSPVNQIDLRK